MAQSRYQRYGKIVVLILLVLLTGWILRPFLSTILLGFVLLFAFYPLHKRLLAAAKSPMLSSLMTVTIIVLCLIIPMTFVVTTLLTEARSSYSVLIEATGGVEATIQSINREFVGLTGLNIDLTQTIHYIFGKVVAMTQDLAIGLPGHVIQFFILIFLLYYMFKEADTIKTFVIKLLPFNKREKEHIVSRVSDVMYGVLFGHLLTGVIQGALAGIGYWIVGLEAPILWAVITMFGAFIPFIGTGLVWVPASLYLILTGLDNGTWGWGLALLLYGGLFVSQVDNFIRPMLIGNRAHMHPTLVLLGALGGLFALGIPGLFIGPLILAIFSQFIIAYEDHHGVL